MRTSEVGRVPKWLDDIARQIMREYNCSYPTAITIWNKKRDKHIQKDLDKMQATKKDVWERI